MTELHEGARVEGACCGMSRSAVGRARNSKHG